MSESPSEAQFPPSSEPTPQPRPESPREPKSARIPLGPDVLVIRDRYESLSIANDVLIGLWFAVGSVLFFSEATMTVATALFVLGSVQMLIRPVIRLSRRLHLKRRGHGQHETQQDF